MRNSERKDVFIEKFTSPRASSEPPQHLKRKRNHGRMNSTGSHSSFDEDIMIRTKDGEQGRDRAGSDLRYQYSVTLCRKPPAHAHSLPVFILVDAGARRNYHVYKPPLLVEIKQPLHPSRIQCVSFPFSLSCASCLAPPLRTSVRVGLLSTTLLPRSLALSPSRCYLISPRIPFIFDDISISQPLSQLQRIPCSYSRVASLNNIVLNNNKSSIDIMTCPTNPTIVNYWGEHNVL
jgi:hypothetical protein